MVAITSKREQRFWLFCKKIKDIGGEGARVEEPSSSVAARPAPYRPVVAWRSNSVRGSVLYSSVSVLRSDTLCQRDRVNLKHYFRLGVVLQHKTSRLLPWSVAGDYSQEWGQIHQVRVSLWFVILQFLGLFWSFALNVFRGISIER